MTCPIAFTTATLAGPVETIGHVSDFDFHNWPFASSNAYYRHDGQDFVRLLPNHKPNPESGGNFSWLLRKPRWETLLQLDAEQFGAFADGDLIRITEIRWPTTEGVPPITPGWHSDTVHKLTGQTVEPYPHMYMVASQHSLLNTEVALSADAPPRSVAKILAINAESDLIQSDALMDYFRTHGGTRQLQAGEVVRMPIRHPHRSAPRWLTEPRRNYELGRLKIMRAAAQSSHK